MSIVAYFGMTVREDDSARDAHGWNVMLKATVAPRCCLPERDPPTRVEGNEAFELGASKPNSPSSVRQHASTISDIPRAPRAR
eukprot:7381835-Prymnesium_polylepis.1